jgi:outer membrane protein TolC
MKRLRPALLGAALTLAGLAGCKQQFFERERDIDHFTTEATKLGAPPDLGHDRSPTVMPGNWDFAEPKTPDHADRPIRYMTLMEAISIALEQGTTGFLTLNGGLGTANETIQSGQGGTFSDSIRVLALGPATAGADIESALSKFDTHYLASATWGKVDNAPVSILQNFQNGDTATVSSGFVKELPTGGVAGITFNMNYLLVSPLPAGGGVFVNPSYRPQLQFQFEQPLLQSYGVEINQLLSAAPAPLTISRFRPSGGRTEGILITRVRYEQAKAEFERNLNHMLLNVEAAYWNLYAAYGVLYARNLSILDAYDLWRNVKNRVEGGLQQPHDEKRVLAQLRSFQAQRVQALGQVIESERQLRLLLGMIDDGTRLVPVDTPTEAPFQADWKVALNEALTNRPELIQARQDLKVHQMDLLVQRNQLKWDLRLVGNYDVNGVGSQLDGSQFDSAGNPRNAFTSFANDKFNTWQYGLLLDIPLGYRDAHAAVRTARMNLLRSYQGLRDNERKAVFQLGLEYSRINEFLRTFQLQHSQYITAQQEYDLLKNRKDLESLATTLESLLNAQQTIGGALAAEFQAVASYNTALAGFQLAKGTIMQYDNVSISEGPLPEAAQIRATDHFRERTKALVLRERPDSAVAPTGVKDIERDPIADLMPPQMDPPPSVLQMMQNREQMLPNAPPAAPMNPQLPMTPASPAPATPPAPGGASGYTKWPTPAAEMPNYRPVAPWQASPVTPAGGTTGPGSR